MGRHKQHTHGDANGVIESRNWWSLIRRGTQYKARQSDPVTGLLEHWPSYHKPGTMPEGWSENQQQLDLNEGTMKENKRNEIEAKWNQLIAKTEQPRSTKVDVKRTLSGAKVIRRRKGNPDLHIA